jgi:hypothetical protein
VWILDRIFNPNWAEFSKLPASRHHDLAIIVCSPFGWAFSVSRTMLPILEQEVRRYVANPSFQLPTFGISQQLAFATLSSCSVPPGKYARSDSLDFSEVHALAMRLLKMQAQSEGVQLSEFAADSDAARVQFLIWLAAELRIDDERFVQKISLEGFGQEWNKIAAGGLAGSAVGLSRVPEEALIERARKQIKTLCPGGMEVIREFCKSPPGASGRTSGATRFSPRVAQAGASIRVAEWRSGSRVNELLEACKQRSSMAAAELSESLDRSLMDVRPMMTMAGFKGSPSEFLVHLKRTSVGHFEETAFLVAFGSMVIRRSTGSRYFILPEWKQLVSQATETLHKMKCRDLSVSIDMFGNSESRSVSRCRELAHKEMVVVQATLLKALSEDSMLSGSPQSRARDLLAAVKLITAFAEMPMPGGSSADLLRRIVEETLEDAPTS